MSYLAPLPSSYSFRERVLARFRSPRNVAYVAQALRRAAPLACHTDDLVSVMAEYGSMRGPGADVIDFDPHAVHGRPSCDLNCLEALQRLNRAFFHQHLARADGPSMGEPLFYRAFEADSLRPPGLEGLIGPGPLWGHGGPFTSGEPSPSRVAPQPGVALSDQAWRAGAPRSVGDTVAECFGFDSPVGAAMGLATPAGTFAPSEGEGLARLMLEASDQARRMGDSAGAALLSGQLGRLPSRRAISSQQHRTGHRPGLYTGRWQSGDGIVAPCNSPDGGDFEETLGRGADEFGGGRENVVRSWNVARAPPERCASYMRLATHD